MEPIIVVDYDPAWPEQFAELAARVQKAFADGPLIAVEHVGSTSVPGLAAKPIIDLNVIIPTRADLPDAIIRLATLGYVHEGDKGVTGREAFLWPLGTARHHLYACAQDNGEHSRHLAFRDYLWAHPEAARQYEALKRDLAARFRNDRPAYNDGKTDFVEAVLAKARVEVVNYDPEWPRLFLAEAMSLHQAFGAALIALEHVGSTAIPGLPARPVIDIQAVVRSVSEAQKSLPALAALGWEQGVFARDPERRLLFKKYHVTGVLSRHLHVYEAGHPAAVEHTLFRDILRRNPDEAKRYLDLKNDLAHQYRHDRIAYSHAKTYYVEAVLRKARESKGE